MPRSSPEKNFFGTASFYRQDLSVPLKQKDCHYVIQRDTTAQDEQEKIKIGNSFKASITNICARTIE